MNIFLNKNRKLYSISDFHFEVLIWTVGTSPWYRVVTFTVYAKDIIRLPRKREGMFAAHLWSKNERDAKIDIKRDCMKIQRKRHSLCLSCCLKHQIDWHNWKSYFFNFKQQNKKKHNLRHSALGYTIQIENNANQQQQIVNNASTRIDINMGNQTNDTFLT